MHTTGSAAGHAPRPGSGAPPQPHEPHGSPGWLPDLVSISLPPAAAAVREMPLSSLGLLKRRIESHRRSAVASAPSALDHSSPPPPGASGVECTPDPRIVASLGSPLPSPVSVAVGTAAAASAAPSTASLDRAVLGYEQETGASDKKQDSSLASPVRAASSGLTGLDNSGSVVASSSAPQVILSPNTATARSSRRPISMHSVKKSHAGSPGGDGSAAVPSPVPGGGPRGLHSPAMLASPAQPVSSSAGMRLEGDGPVARAAGALPERLLAPDDAPVAVHAAAVQSPPHTSGSPPRPRRKAPRAQGQTQQQPDRQEQPHAGGAFGALGADSPGVGSSASSVSEPQPALGQRGPLAVASISSSSLFPGAPQPLTDAAWTSNGAQSLSVLDANGKAGAYARNVAPGRQDGPNTMSRASPPALPAGAPPPPTPALLAVVRGGSSPAAAVAVSADGRDIASLVAAASATAALSTATALDRSQREAAKLLATAPCVSPSSPTAVVTAAATTGAVEWGGLSSARPATSAIVVAVDVQTRVAVQQSAGYIAPAVVGAGGVVAASQSVAAGRSATAPAGAPFPPLPPAHPPAPPPVAPSAPAPKPSSSGLRNWASLRPAPLEILQPRPAPGPRGAAFASGDVSVAAASAIAASARNRSMRSNSATAAPFSASSTATSSASRALAGGPGAAGNRGDPASGAAPDGTTRTQPLQLPPLPPFGRGRSLGTAAVPAPPPAAAAVVDGTAGLLPWNPPVLSHASGIGIDGRGEGAAPLHQDAEAPAAAGEGDGEAGAGDALLATSAAAASPLAAGALPGALPTPGGAALTLLSGKGLVVGGSSSGSSAPPRAPVLSSVMKGRVEARLRRPHKPKVLKRLEQGEETYARRRAAKALGKIIGKEHALYQLSFGMMLGIYMSVVTTPPVGAEKLLLDDFMKVRKLPFPPGGSPFTPPHRLPGTFKFKDYAPKVFHHLRERWDIDQAHYLRSLGGAYEYIEFNSNSKSGSFFFYSHDGRFMIKTQSAAESKFLRRILAHYYNYCMAHPWTYVTRFYGMHRIKMPHLGSRKLHFVVMASVFAGDHEVHEMYDLKGSTVGRSATPAEKARGPARCVYKDMDMDERGVVLRIGGGARRDAFLAQLRSDADFLASCGIMDYSLLLGIHSASRRDTAEGHVILQGTRGAQAAAAKAEQEQQQLLLAGVPEKEGQGAGVHTEPPSAAPPHRAPGVPSLAVPHGSGAPLPPPLTPITEAPGAEDDEAASARLPPVPAPPAPSGPVTGGATPTAARSASPGSGSPGSDASPGAVSNNSPGAVSDTTEQARSSAVMSGLQAQSSAAGRVLAAATAADPGAGGSGDGGAVFWSAGPQGAPSAPPQRPVLPIGPEGVLLGVQGGDEEEGPDEYAGEEGAGQGAAAASGSVSRPHHRPGDGGERGSGPSSDDEGSSGSEGQGSGQGAASRRGLRGATVRRVDEAGSGSDASAGGARGGGDFTEEEGSPGEGAGRGGGGPMAWGIGTGANSRRAAPAAAAGGGAGAGLEAPSRTDAAAAGATGSWRVSRRQGSLPEVEGEGLGAGGSSGSRVLGAGTGLSPEAPSAASSASSAASARKVPSPRSSRHAPGYHHSAPHAQRLSGPIASLSIGEHGAVVSGLPRGATQTPPGPSREAGGGVQGFSPSGAPYDEIYYFGIIDILQQYDLRKMGETAIKSLMHPMAGISAVAPKFYADRFVKFIADHTQ